VSNGVRALAGILILSGLIVTLARMQTAVGTLSNTFSKMAHEQTDTSPTENAAGDVVTGMSQVADAAKGAFQISATLIFSAAFFLFSALIVRMMATRVLNSFVEWARVSYDNSLPEHVSLGTVAVQFRSSARSLEVLTKSFNDMTESFGALQGFAESMDNARTAIVEAVQQLPVHIQASVGTLSKRFVNAFAEGMRSTSEHTSQILLIYGHQKQRIDHIQEQVQAIHGFAAEMAAIASQLRGLPENVKSVAEGTEAQKSGLQAFGSTVAELAIRLEELPVRQLVDEVNRLAGIVEGAQTSLKTVEKFGERISENTNALRPLPEVAKTIRTAVQHEAENSASFRDSVDQLRLFIEGFPVEQLRNGIESLVQASRSIGSIQGQAIVALDELTRNAADVADGSREMQRLVEQIANVANQLSAEQSRLGFEGRDEGNINGQLVQDRSPKPTVPSQPEPLVLVADSGNHEGSDGLGTIAGSFEERTAPDSMASFTHTPLERR
jgi:methyl-accepting chemotaxis protein